MENLCEEKKNNSIEMILQRELLRRTEGKMCLNWYLRVSLPIW